MKKFTHYWKKHLDSSSTVNYAVEDMLNDLAENYTQLLDTVAQNEIRVCKILKELEDYQKHLISFCPCDKHK